MKKVLTQAIALVKEYKFSFILITAIFLVGILAGISVPLSVKYRYIDLFTQKIARAGNIDMWFIFFNNLVACMIMIIGGFLVIIPPLVVFINGLLLGAIMPLSISVIGVKGALSGLLIHGIFELAGFIFAGTIGYLITLMMFKRLRSITWRELITHISFSLFLIIIPLLLLSAVLELNVSQNLVSKSIAQRVEKLNISAELEDLQKNGFYSYDNLFLNHKYQISPLIRQTITNTNFRFPIELMLTNSRDAKLMMMITENPIIWNYFHTNTQVYTENLESLTSNNVIMEMLFAHNIKSRLIDVILIQTNMKPAHLNEIIEIFTSLKYRPIWIESLSNEASQ